ncbi:MAG: pyridoxamine 5'-phosphate oxidase [Pseudomonadota bacterium]
MRRWPCAAAEPLANRVQDTSSPSHRKRRSMKLNQEILDLFDKGMRAAIAASVPEPTAMTLATADQLGQPSARTVLLKGVDESGFTFFTNLNSRKGRHLKGNAKAGLVFWWRETEQQVLVDGQVLAVGDAEADAYFASRPRGSQIGAWASQQSSPLDSRQELIDRVAELEQQYNDQTVPRPPHWSGFTLEPHRVEFWYGREYRLHERICFEADETAQAGWRKTLLFP